MATNEPPKASYTLTLDCTIEGLTAPLQVQADNMNELRRAVRLLQANNFLVPQCPTHRRAMKPSQHGGWYCTAKNGEGAYCKERIT